MSPFHPFPELSSGRLRLREVSMEDALTVLYLRSDAEITQYIERSPDRLTRTMDDAQMFIDFVHNAAKTGESIMWAICAPDDETMRGSICLWNFSEDRKKAEVGYDLKQNYQGKGYMNESMELVLDYGFRQLNLETIEAFTHRENRASIRLLERNGFQLQPHRTDPENANNLIFIRFR